MNQAAPTCLFDADEKPSLDLVDIPLIEATEATVRRYGCLVEEPDDIEIEIVRWPQQGWRPVDEGPEDEAGWVEGVFHGNWSGDVLMGINDADDGHHVLGWSVDPQTASAEVQTAPRERVLLWHLNYHPDGGQLFFPLDKKPFVVPVALPGDGLTPDKVVAFWCDGRRGLYIHPNIWHEGLFPVDDNQRSSTAKVGCTRGSVAISARSSAFISQYRCT